MARKRIRSLANPVIESQFFTLFDSFATKEQDAGSRGERDHVWITRVVHVLGAAASDSSVEQPPTVQAKEVVPPGIPGSAELSRPAEAFLYSDAFARVLHDLSTLWNHFSGKDAKTIN